MANLECGKIAELQIAHCIAQIAKKLHEYDTVFI